MLAKEQDIKNKERIKILEDRLKIHESSDLLVEISQTKKYLAVLEKNNEDLKEKLRIAELRDDKMKHYQDFIAYMQCQACLLEDILLDQ